MKPINEMTLAECIARLREELMPVVMVNGKVYHGMFDHQHRIEIADRIHELTRWIPVEERLPTEADADENGRVLWYCKDQYQLTLMWDMPRWKMSYERVTHWRRSDNPDSLTPSG
jgi:hypothetical protein